MPRPSTSPWSLASRSPTFATGDVTLSGTAGATTATVTGSGTTYNVAVSGMTANGTVIASLLAGVAHDAANNPSLASTSTDNTVTFSSLPLGDYNQDGTVDAADYTVWRNSLGHNGARTICGRRRQWERRRWTKPITKSGRRISVP